MGNPVQISGVIITYNEEKNIERCINSLQDLVDEIVVVDSYSTDDTKSICQNLGIRFIEHNFEGHIEQKNFAMRQATHHYILSLDADEMISSQLKSSILEVKKNWDGDGYSVNRLNNYCGKWIRHSGWYPDRKIRLWDRRKGQSCGTNPHDKVELTDGKVQFLKGDLLHYAYREVGEHIEQINKFAIIAAEEAYLKGRKSNFLIHVILNPWFKFFRKYFLQLGFLDGYYGFVFCSVASVFNFFKYLRLKELYKSKE